MKRILICKADPVGSQVAEDVTITIDRELPEFSGSLSEADAFYAIEATTIEDALHKSLPGGVYDQLLCLMMQQRTSLFRVPLFSEDE